MLLKLFEIPLSKIEVHQVLVTFTLLLFDSGVCLPFNNRNAQKLIRNQKTNRENKFEPEQTLDFLKKKSSPI